MAISSNITVNQPQLAVKSHVTFQHRRMRAGVKCGKVRVSSIASGFSVAAGNM